MDGLLNPYWIQIFGFACIFAVSALGLNVIYGYTGLFSLGHAAFYGAGAYTAAFLMKGYVGAFGDEAFLPAQAAFLGSLAAGGLVAALLAFLVGLPVLRLTSDYLGIATLGFGVIMKVLFDNADSLLPQLGGARGMTGIPRMTGTPWVVAGLVAAILVARNLVHSTYGRALIAIREDEGKAEAVGINTMLYKVLAFGISAYFMAVAGGIYSYFFTYIDPQFIFDIFTGVTMVLISILGGRGTLWGPVLGAFIMEPLGNWIIGTFGGTQIHLTVFGGILLLVMLFMPQGILPTLSDLIKQRQRAKLAKVPSS